MADDNRAIRRRYHDAWNAGDSDALDSIMAPDVKNNSPLQGQAAGVEGFKQALQWMRAGVPDLAITIDTSVSEGDLVATRWTGSGTQTGTLMGIPPTGKSVTVSGIDICRIEGGRIVEYWQQLDTLGMLQQLGAIPPPQEAAATPS